jgi:DNA polymerase III subunit delta'
MFFQWQQAAWQQIVRSVRENRLPHALLLTGDKGIGKLHFANGLAMALLCPAFHKTGERCLHCQSCQLAEAQTHPDLFNVESEPGHAIKVDSIREVTSFVNQTALLGGYRVIIINPASSMNMNAANALLKTLEEPTPHTLLILISEQGLSLPATVLSRCQKLVFHKPTKTQALDWLRKNLKENEADLSLLLDLCQGAPLAAVEFFKQGIYEFRQECYGALQQLAEGQVGPVELSLKWQEKNPQAILKLLSSWINDLLRIKLITRPEVIINHDFQSILTSMSQQLSLNDLVHYSDFLKQIYKSLSTGCNLNQRLLTEDLLIKWSIIIQRAPIEL